MLQESSNEKQFLINSGCYLPEVATPVVVAFESLDDNDEEMVAEFLLEVGQFQVEHLNNNQSNKNIYGMSPELASLEMAVVPKGVWLEGESVVV